MAKLPPRVVGKKKKTSEKPAKRVREPEGESDAPLERTDAARNFGISMMVGGAICTVLPLFGLQLKNLGENGRFTPVVGIILLVIGVISFVVSLSKTSANLATLGVKIVMWGIIGFMVLILVVGGAALIFMR